MTTKFNVTKVTEKGEKKNFDTIGTAIIYDDAKAGIIKSKEWGDLHLYLKDKQGSSGHDIYVVKKAKPGKKEGDKAIMNEVGTFLLRAEKAKGVLFLHLITDSFPVFIKTAKDKEEAPEDPAAAAA